MSISASQNINNTVIDFSASQTPAQAAQDLSDALQQGTSASNIARITHDLEILAQYFKNHPNPNTQDPYGPYNYSNPDLYMLANLINAIPECDTENPPTDLGIDVFTGNNYSEKVAYVTDLLSSAAKETLPNEFTSGLSLLQQATQGLPSSDFSTSPTYGPITSTSSDPAYLWNMMNGLTPSNTGGLAYMMANDPLFASLFQGTMQEFLASNTPTTLAGYGYAAPGSQFFTDFTTLQTLINHPEPSNPDYVRELDESWNNFLTCLT